MASKKIPCGGFGYDDNDFEFVTPTGGGIPTLKSKGGAVPSEVTNAIETGGMGWTDEDETVHQIDEKYIPSSTVVIYGVLIENEFGEFTFTPTTQFDKTASEVLEDVKNGINYVLLVQTAGDVISYMKVEMSTISPSVNIIAFGTMGTGGIIYNNGQWSVLEGE